MYVCVCINLNNTSFDITECGISFFTSMKCWVVRMSEVKRCVGGGGECMTSR